MGRSNGSPPSRASASTTAAAWQTPLCADQPNRQVRWREGHRNACSAEVRQLTAGADKNRAVSDVDTRGRSCSGTGQSARWNGTLVTTTRDRDCS